MIHLYNGYYGCIYIFYGHYVYMIYIDMIYDGIKFMDMHVYICGYACMEWMCMYVYL